MYNMHVSNIYKIERHLESGGEEKESKRSEVGQRAKKHLGVGLRLGLKCHNHHWKRGQ